MAFDPVQTFLQEADELLAEIEACALALDSGEPGGETVNRLFRSFHTLKGSGAMCGFDKVSKFTHRIESLLDRVREGALPVSPKLTELMLAAKDHIRELLLVEQGGGEAPLEPEQRIAAMIEELCPATGGPSPARAPAAPSAVESPHSEQAWTIRFKPEPRLLASGGDPILLFRDLKKLGECEIRGHADAVPPLDEMEPDACYLWWSIRLVTAADLNAIRDVFLFVEDGSELEITLEAASPRAVAAAQPTPQPVRQVIAKESTVRVPAARLDRLVGLVGELVMNQSRLAQAAAGAGPELAGPVEEIERLVAELRDRVLGIRMMPIGSIFGRFRRLVHDLSAELGKEIDLVTEGEETELDKSVLDQLGEPLVHLLRNSIDHGIEAPDRREPTGKPRRGTIRLSARHEGTDVVVSVEDDGRGLDREAIRAKAAAKGLVAEDAALSEKEILGLILLPGFSTAERVTSVSGRGVGLDVVRKQIEALRGSVSISTQPGCGTTFSLRLPLTLAIIDGLLVEIGRDQLIVPMAAVMENVEIRRADRALRNGRNLVAIRGELVPYIDLRSEFSIAGQEPAIEKIVVVRHEGERVGFLVDRVLGTHQTVIQPLGRFFRGIDVVSGATIMGDGRVALILDTAAAVRFADRRVRAAHESEARLRLAG